ncbi:hypothetical protein SDC9_126505 [bioreactor metagenome]|uniref:HNH nuclease domain-containing protein n=1 Tax=bioreactor metagenome TaxID=1076179 RepID=A0A645CRC1_9ZZZZ
MPFMTNGKRDYQKEKNWEKTKKPKRLKDRVQRIQARREVEKTTGNLPSSQHVHHKKDISRGGTNAKSNLSVISAKSNLRKEALRKKRAK